MNLFCLHGFTGTPGVWEPVLERLEGVTAWCPALLGHGDEGEKASTIERQNHPPCRHQCSDASTFAGEVDRLAGWLGDRSEEPCHLLGYSMGARVGLALLLTYPRLFVGATLVGVHPGLVDQAERSQRATLDESRAQDLETHGVRRFIDRWQQIPLFASQEKLPPAVLAQQQEMRLGHRAAGLARALRVLGLAKMPNYRDRLPTLGLPVRLVVGEKDRKFQRLAQDMVELQPRFEVVQIPGVGHNVVLEAPAAMAQIVAQACGGFC